jgi:hypothetical protein
LNLISPERDKRWVAVMIIRLFINAVSEVLAASIIRAMVEAARTSKTSVNFYQTTRRYNPEDSHLLSLYLVSKRQYHFQLYLITSRFLAALSCRAISRVGT